MSILITDLQKFFALGDRDRTLTVALLFVFAANMIAATITLNQEMRSQK